MAPNLLAMAFCIYVDIYIYNIYIYISTQYGKHFSSPPGLDCTAGLLAATLPGVLSVGRSGSRMRLTNDETNGPSSFLFQF